MAQQHEGYLTLEARLAHGDAGVRRVAARDLCALNDVGDTLCDIVVARIVVETDDRARHLLVRFLGERLIERGRCVLESLVADGSVSVVVAHEARVGLDRLDLAAGGRLGGRLGT